MNIDICTAILALDSAAQVTIRDEDYAQIEWSDGNPNNITVDQIKTKQAELKTAYVNAKYQRDRATAYPSIVDQLDDLYHNGLDGWKKTIKGIKDKYPKG